MLPGMELMGCTDLAVPAEVMHHVVGVESSFNPFAIGVVGGRLARQPRTLEEALSTSRMLEREGYNFSLGLAQVNRHNLTPQGLDSHERAFDVCANLRAGARILADCHRRAGGDWGKAFSCYYSGNFETGFRHGYVQKVLAAWQGAGGASAIPVLPRSATPARTAVTPVGGRVERRVAEAASPGQPTHGARISEDTPPAQIRADRAPAVNKLADAPVTVQASGTRAPATAAALSEARSTPTRDAAFVF